jgi:hypothetical protein
MSVMVLNATYLVMAFEIGGLLGSVPQKYALNSKYISDC